MIKVFQFVALAALIVFCLWIAHDDSGIIQRLEKEGYTQIELRGSNDAGCQANVQLSRAFVANDVWGKSVRGTYCMYSDKIYYVMRG